MGDYVESGRSQISETDTEDLMIEADVNVGLNHLNVSLELDAEQYDETSNNNVNKNVNNNNRDEDTDNNNNRDEDDDSNNRDEDDDNNNRDKDDDNNNRQRR